MPNSSEVYRILFILARVISSRTEFMTKALGKFRAEAE